MQEQRIVRKVITHIHLDEAFALYMALKYGKHIFQGIETATRDYASHAKKPLEQIMADQELWIGCGGDIDEHCNGKTSRLPNTSASRIMAKRINILHDPNIVSMVKEVTHFDNNIGCPKHHLGSLVKMFKMNRPGGERVAMRWCLRIIQAVHVRLSRNLFARSDEPSFCDFVRELLTKTSFSDPQAEDGLRALLEKEILNTDPLIFGLQSIYASLWRGSSIMDLSKRYRDVTEDMQHILTLLYLDQVNFHSFRRVVKSSEFEGYFRLDVGGVNGSIVQVKAGATIDQADNPQAHNAMRSDQCMITAIKGSRGNVSILGNLKEAEKRGLMPVLNEGLSSLVAMLRFLDLPIADRKTVNWEVLRCRGNCPGEPCWYLSDANHLSLFNGTQNHDAPRTKLTLKEIRAVMLQAFVPEYVEQWKKDHRVPDNQGYVPPVHEGFKHYDGIRHMETLLLQSA